MPTVDFTALRARKITAALQLGAAQAELNAQNRRLAQYRQRAWQLVFCALGLATGLAVYINLHWGLTR